MNNLAEEQEVISEENMKELPKKEEEVNDFEVEIVDDTPEEDRVPKRKEASELENES